VMSTSAIMSATESGRKRVLSIAPPLYPFDITI